MFPCCGGSEDGDDRKISRQIDTNIKKTRKQREKHVKLLLLGTGDAGKSTFAKQMKVLHQEGFSSTEHNKYKTILQNNCISMIKVLISGAQERNISIDAKLQNHVHNIMTASSLTPPLAQAIKMVWLSPGIQEMYGRANELSTLSCQSQYYFENVERIASPDYTPTMEDILRAKMKTTGIIETAFKAGGFEFTIVDVGGQRTERRKWLHCFDNVTAVIFLAALDAYDMTLEEDNTCNRMEESIKLFGDLSRSEWFLNTSFILFLNKSDIFKEKIERCPLSRHFPDFRGCDFDEAAKYIESKYRNNFGGKKLPPCYVTCAVDTDNVRKVFYSVKSFLLKNTLEELSLLPNE